MESAVRTLSLLFALCLAGCLTPNPPDGSITCNPNGKACPDGYVCGAGNKCVHMGASATDGGASCADYCDCMSVACSSFFADEGTCLSVCMNLAPSALSCRVFHCGLAMTDPATHCPHAEGKAICQ